MSTRSRPALGVGLMVGSAACFATMDSTTRWLGAVMPVTLMLWARYTLHAAVMGGWLALRQRSGLRSAQPGFQVLRGLLLLCSSTFAFFGLQHLPVAEYTAIVMLTPLIVTLAAAVLLKEPVSRLRWALVVGGFVGALCVIRPGSGLFGWAVLMPLGGAFCNAGFQLLTSRIGSRDSAYTTNFYSGLTGTLVLTPILLLSAIDLDGALAGAPALHWVLLLTIGVLGTAGHLLLAMAFGHARTSTLMPFSYTQIGFAALVGWLVFARLPDAWAWLGMAVIAGCGAASAWLNVRDARTPAPRTATDTLAD